MDAQQTQIKKLEAALAKLQKTVQVISARLIRLEKDNATLRGRVSRSQLQLGTHEQHIQRTSRG